MKRLNAKNQSGFSLLEMTVAIIILGMLLAVAMQSMNSVVEDTRTVKSEREMELLAKSIVGDPDITQGGGRVDFGYVGDVGAFPPNLNALYSNPGGYSTWKGPYLPAGYTQDSTGLKTDEWGSTYNYSGGIIVTSTGSGSTITKKIANATSDYLRNTYNGTISDQSDFLPGSIYKDSIDVKIAIPDGTGGTITKLYHPDPSGNFILDSIPAGTHPLRIIYKPNVDTIFRYLTIYPRHKSSTQEFRFGSNYFSGTSASSSIVYVSGTAKTTGADCDKIEFNVTNTYGVVNLTSMTLTWASPTAYYEKIKIGGTTVWDKNNPRTGSGQQVNFTTSKAIYGGQTVTIIIEKFTSTPSGGGSKVNMKNTTFTAAFSDGSVITFTTGNCT